MLLVVLRTEFAIVVASVGHFSLCSRELFQNEVYFQSCYTLSSSEPLLRNKFYSADLFLPPFSCFFSLACSSWRFTRNELREIKLWSRFVTHRENVFFIDRYIGQIAIVFAMRRMTCHIELASWHAEGMFDRSTCHRIIRHTNFCSWPKLSYLESNDIASYDEENERDTSINSEE